MQFNLTREQALELSRAAHLVLEYLPVTDSKRTALSEAQQAIYKQSGIEQALAPSVKPGDLVQIRNSRLGGRPGAMYVVKVYKKTLKAAYPDVYENYQAGGGELSYSSYSISAVEKVLATREELEARK